MMLPLFAPNAAVQGSAGVFAGSQQHYIFVKINVCNLSFGGK
jgi:hypothetical protein